MSEANKATVRRFYEEFINQGNLAVADEIFVPDFVIHTPPSPPGMAGGTEGLKQMFAMYRNGFPDLRVTVEEMVAEGVLSISKSGTDRDPRRLLL